MGFAGLAPGELRSPDASSREIGEIIGKDPAMTAKILQLVNSAFFGLGQRVSDSGEAATLIGLDTLKELILSFGIFSQFDQTTIKDGRFSIESMLHHSLAVGRLARRIAEAEGANREMSNDCFLAGMLHDIGILILEQDFPEECAKVRALTADQEMDPVLAEREIFSTTHGAVGAYLLGIWALADPVVEAVAFHHQPELSKCSKFCPLAAVHAADFLTHRTGLSPSTYPKETRVLNYKFLARIGLAERLDIWAQLPSEGDEA